MKRRLICLILCLCMLTSLCALAIPAADKPTTGTVYNVASGSKLYVREKAGTGQTVVDRLSSGDVVTILGTAQADGITWYKVVTPNNITGYASVDYIKVNVVYENDKEFEKYLDKQDFPEDYKVKLRQIYAEHPNWVFKAQHLSVTWAEAYAAETTALKNAVASPNAWKSMEYGAYDWKTGTYVAVDSGGWVTAAPAVVAYYLDPRNFLDSTYIFQFEDLQFSSSQTVEGIRAILPARFDKHAEDLLAAAKEAKVSAYFLATRMAQEGSKVDGTFAGYEGYYNFFNYGAYAHSGRGAVTNGAIYAKNQGWNTPYACLLGSAKKIGNSYINKEQNTLYYQKFDVTDGGNGYYNHQYMTNVQAPSSEGAIRAKSATKAELSSALTFIIPVYQDMPKEETVLPGRSGDNNNFLDSLTVKGCKLSPTFDRYTDEYSAMVKADVVSVEISAVTNSPDATIKGTGTVKLKPGENILPVTVTATSGQTRVYTLSITRNAPIPEGEEPVITGNAYSLSDGIITAVQPGTSIETFVETLKIDKGIGKVFDADGEEKTDGMVATGDILRLMAGEMVCDEYPVVIYGDVNGDGAINSQDLRHTQRHILGVKEIDGYPLTAADTNQDDTVNSQDLRRTQRYILGILEELQPKPTESTDSTSATTGKSTTSKTTGKSESTGKTTATSNTTKSGSEKSTKKSTAKTTKTTEKTTP